LTANNAGCAARIVSSLASLKNAALAPARHRQTSQKKRKKKSKAPALLQRLCRPYFPEYLDLFLIGGATLLVRARAPPETWTTRLQPFDQPETALVDYLFVLVIIFSNDCSKFEQTAK
jgi:hypothetical protein